MGNSIVKKIWRDLVERKARTLLTIVGLGIGYWGVGSAFVAWYVLSNDLSENFRQTNPAAIVMTLEGRAPADIADLGTIEGVAAIENRPEFAGRMRYAADGWMPMRLWIVEDFDAMQVATVVAESGTVPPNEGKLVLERDSLLVANFFSRRAETKAVGHGPAAASGASYVPLEDRNIDLRLAGGVDITTGIDGTVFDPAQAPSRMEMAIYAYATRETAAGWGITPDDRLLITPAPGYESDAAIRATASRLEARVAELGYEVAAVRYPSHTEHIHQFQMNSILWLIMGVGLLALFMSVVLVVNLVTGILTNQVRQLGVLKAIGASARQVTVMYAGGMWLIGMLAAVVTLPVAIDSGMIVARVVSAQLNFEQLTLALPWSTRIGFLLLASLFPVLAALPTIRRWSGVSVTDALVHNGADLDTLGQRQVERLRGRLPLNVLVGIRNGLRNPQRTLLTAATVAVGVLVFMAAMNMRASLVATAEVEEEARRYDVAVNFEEPTDARRIAFMSQFQLVERVETWQAERVELDAGHDGQSTSYGLLRVPDDSDMMRPNVLEGAWLSSDAEGGVVISHRTQQEQPQLRPGAPVVLQVGGQQLALTVVGVIKEFGPALFYIRDVDYRAQVAVTDERVNLAFVRLQDFSEQNLATVLRLLESHFEMANVRVRTIQSSKRASRIIRGHLDSIVFTLLILAGAMLGVSTLGMMSAISTNVVERTRELAILRSIGGKPGAIRTIVTSEAVFMAAIAWLLALVLSAFVGPLLSAYFGEALVEYPFDFRFSLQGIALSLGIAMLLAAVACVTPVRAINRRAVSTALQESD